MKKFLLMGVLAIGLISTGASAQIGAPSKMPPASPDIVNDILQIPSFLVCYGDLSKPVNGSGTIAVFSHVIANLNVKTDSGSFDVYDFNVVLAESKDSRTFNEEFTFDNANASGNFENLSDTENLIALKYDDSNVLVDITSTFTKDDGQGYINIRNLGDTKITETVKAECKLFAMVTPQ